MRAAEATPSHTLVARPSSAQGMPGHPGVQPPSPRQPAGTRLSWRPAGASVSQGGCLCPHPGTMLRRGYRASERRRQVSDRLSWQQDQALSSSIYLLREMGPTGFLLREEEPQNRDFRVTTAPDAPPLPPRGPPSPSRIQPPSQSLGPLAAAPARACCRS